MASGDLRLTEPQYRILSELGAEVDAEVDAQFAKLDWITNLRKILDI